ncbi:MAG: B12-binding domain-containing radical SAM protein [Clostridia bacterium]|nr:B12-binding domain-containing radical SAM protein [Clostridia bacterium]
MKTLLVALNSKYIHSSLAVWYLKASCGPLCGDVKVMEFTINDQPDAVLASIYREHPDNVAFSCYIWNFGMVTKIAQNLKKVCPEIKIILGGPEVSFDPGKIMEQYFFIDYIVTGEGEIVLNELLSGISEGQAVEPYIDGLWWRNEASVVSGKKAKLIEELDSIPSPYTDEMIHALGNRIVYFESSRGCPFSCAYCISSTFEGVRYFSMERVKKDLKKLVKSGVRQVKFVDRTFNCNKIRAKEIFKTIIENYKDINFHFEAAADLFDEEMLEILRAAEPGLIQFEIGIQSTNLKTLEAVTRKTSLEKVFNYIRRIREMGNIHIHLDLIAGLPYEDFESFGKSFDEVYTLSPHQLQLGFLKMLKGSRVRNESDLFGYQYRLDPPYEVLCSQFLSYEEMLQLKGIEELVDRYYNSGKFIETFQYVMELFYQRPFDFFLAFSKVWEQINQAVAGRDLYTLLLEFVRNRFPKEEADFIGELLKFDYLCSDNTNNLPRGLNRIEIPGFREKCFAFLKEEENIKRYLNGYLGLPSKQIIKTVHFEVFHFDVTGRASASSSKEKGIVVLFDYKKKDKVTGRYPYYKVEMDLVR